ncbi:hypothetical protein K488DRAFT_74835 [Vararia minispora EC-137]|uniref:Uncharacterized protein n=1 Tax=Vararia minispora EC-137 TaxID=1314806 RepID=A0ACB8Q5Y3_9AGAM|nr:hypothetical protein K488DRAFT_74835 [Vararia minispora EC-137]
MVPLSSFATRSMTTGAVTIATWPATRQIELDLLGCILGISLSGWERLNVGRSYKRFFRLSGSCATVPLDRGQSPAHRARLRATFFNMEVLPLNYLPTSTGSRDEECRTWKSESALDVHRRLLSSVVQWLTSVRLRKSIKFLEGGSCIWVIRFGTKAMKSLYVTWMWLTLRPRIVLSVLTYSLCGFNDDSGRCSNGHTRRPEALLTRQELFKERSSERRKDIVLETSRRLWEEKKRLPITGKGDRSVTNEGGEAKDIWSIMFRANVGASEEELMTQIATFTVAGSNTTSNALFLTFHLLSLHPVVQDKLCEKLTGARVASGEFTSDDLIDLPYYLEAVCPTVPSTSRKGSTAREDFILPLAHPFTDINDKDDNEFFVSRGTTIFANTIGVNQDQGSSSGGMLRLQLGLLSEWKYLFALRLTFIGGSRACMYMTDALLLIALAPSNSSHRGFKHSQLEMSTTL